MRTVNLPDGEKIPTLGLGTWRMGEQAEGRETNVHALRFGLELGLKLIDTAEMYGEGGAEEVVGEAIAGQRDEVFVVSKVYPHNASKRGAIEACERSLRRLNTDRIDLYLLHWRGGIPLQETIDAFEQLKTDGKIRHWGVSNFDTEDMHELRTLSNGVSCSTNQVLYHLGERGIEWDLLPHCQNHSIPVMAYSPLGQGTILRHRAIRNIADRYYVTPATVALTWVLRNPNIIAIPKSSDVVHVREIAAAMNLELSDEDVSDLDQAFPAPQGPKSLAIL